MRKQSTFALPPLTTHEKGKERTVGIEVEFGGLEGETAAKLVRELFGGEIVRRDAHSFHVKRTTLGDFKVKLDTRFGHYRGDSQDILEKLEARLSAALGTAASLFVPYEIVAPPVPLTKLPMLEGLLSKLRGAGAIGTENSIFFAYGLHLNPEAARLHANSLTAMLKAFAMLSPWLREAISPDLTRRLLGFADPFPDTYRKMLARSDYWPGIETLIDDYIDANPTRNRDLDMLPLFAHLDEMRVRARLPDEKVNPRPTFHYRLPDARLSDPEWNLVTEWNRWVEVERLAADRTRLEEICEAYLRQADEDSWARRVEALFLA